MKLQLNQSVTLGVPFFDAPKSFTVTALFDSGRVKLKHAGVVSFEIIVPELSVAAPVTPISLPGKVRAGDYAIYHQPHNGRDYLVKVLAVDGVRVCLTLAKPCDEDGLFRFGHARWTGIRNVRKCESPTPPVAEITPVVTGPVYRDFFWHDKTYRVQLLSSASYNSRIKVLWPPCPEFPDKHCPEGFTCHPGELKVPEPLAVGDYADYRYPETGKIYRVVIEKPVPDSNWFVRLASRQDEDSYFTFDGGNWYTQASNLMKVPAPVLTEEQKAEAYYRAAVSPVLRLNIIKSVLSSHPEFTDDQRVALWLFAAQEYAQWKGASFCSVVFAITGKGFTYGAGYIALLQMKLDSETLGDFLSEFRSSPPAAALCKAIQFAILRDDASTDAEVAAAATLYAALA